MKPTNNSSCQDYPLILSHVCCCIRGGLFTLSDYTTYSVVVAPLHMPTHIHGQSTLELLPGQYNNNI